MYSLASRELSLLVMADVPETLPRKRFCKTKFGWSIFCLRIVNKINIKLSKSTLLYKLAIIVNRRGDC